MATTETEEIKNRRWIESKLRAARFVEWDRFTVGDWNGSQCVSVFGWIDREEDEYKDFALVMFWPESEGLYNTTSSARYSEKLTEAIHGSSDTHNDCQRVEDTFNVSNAVEATENKEESDQ